MRGAQAAEPPAAQSTSLLSIPPRSWVVDAAANELVALHHKDSYLRYRMDVDQREGRPGPRRHRKQGRYRGAADSERRKAADCRAGQGGARAVERHDRLSCRLRQTCQERRSGKEDGGHTGSADAGRHDQHLHPGPAAVRQEWRALEIVLDYKPNPKLSPPTTEARRSPDCEGRVWIDAKTRYVVRMEGTIFRGVNFGWGMLAHIYPGGKLVMEPDQRRAAIAGSSPTFPCS